VAGCAANELKPAWHGLLTALPAIDSDALADARRRELDIPRDVAAALGRAAVRAAEQGSYVAPQSEWRALLALRAEPRWLPWHLWYSFAIDFWSWSQSPKAGELSDYAADVGLRELRGRHGLFFRYFAHELQLPALQNDLGTSREMFASLLEWLRGYTHRQKTGLTGIAQR
jgi:hypothetical protein